MLKWNTMRAIIVAFSQDHTIGLAGEIPWMGKMPADLARVRKLTENQAIIMGLNTFLSIKKPLRNRDNIVLADKNFAKNYRKDHPEFIKNSTTSLFFTDSLEAAFARVPEDKIAFIFGGARVYADSLARAEELEIDTIFATEIHETFSGDTFFPKIDPKIWRESSREDFEKDEKNLFYYSFVKYVRAKF